MEKRLSAQVKTISCEHSNDQSENPYPTQEVKRRSGTGVELPSGTGWREEEWEPRVKMYRSSIYEVSPKGKK